MFSFANLSVINISSAYFDCQKVTTSSGWHGLLHGIVRMQTRTANEASVAYLMFACRSTRLSCPCLTLVSGASLAYQKNTRELCDRLQERAVAHNHVLSLAGLLRTCLRSYLPSVLYLPPK